MQFHFSTCCAFLLHFVSAFYRYLYVSQFVCSFYHPVILTMLPYLIRYIQGFFFSLFENNVYYIQLYMPT